MRLITLAPGHFHAALVHKRMSPGIERRVAVYAPLDRDLVAHIERVAGFNNRPDEPTAWELDVHAGADFLDQFALERPGSAVVLSGRNQPKIDWLLRAVSLGLHVLADKPWVIDPADFPKVEVALRDAENRGVFVWDMMTERHDVTTRLQRELIRCPEIFGTWQTGPASTPSLEIESVHCLKKTVAGQPLLRPWWWFDAKISGEPIADVGTHLADLAIGFISPTQALDYRRHVQVTQAERSTFTLTEAQFAVLTGLPNYPDELLPSVVGGGLPCSERNEIDCLIQNVPVKLTTIWNYESAGAGDTHNASARGTRATLAVRQSAEGGSVPELFITPAAPRDRPRIVAALQKACAAWQERFPGTHVRDTGGLIHVAVPPALRIGHEAHFAEVTREFLAHVVSSHVLPAWERASLLAKYYLTTTAVELLRKRQA